MNVSSTLSRYISAQFLLNFFYLLLILLGVIYLLDLLEMMRRAAGYPGVGFGIIAEMALLKLPLIGMRLLPFAVLFGAIFTFWRLTRTNELVIARTAGLSAWQFLAPVLIATLAIGVFSTTVINPVSAVLLTKYDDMEILYLQKKSNIITVSKTGLWLRQHETDGYSLLHATNFDPANWQLNNVVIFYFDRNDGLEKRIDAASASLRDGYWEARNVFIHDKEPPAQRKDAFVIPTTLTADEIEESFADPDTLPFWQMPDFITMLEETGFSATRIKVYYQSLLAQPFFFAAMILLAACVSLRPSRQGGAGFLIIIGVGLGFFIFFMESVLHAFGISHKIPVALAAWTPATVSLLLGGAVLFHLEDG